MIRFPVFTEKTYIIYLCLKLGNNAELFQYMVGNELYNIMTAPIKTSLASRRCLFFKYLRVVLAEIDYPEEYYM